jgi:hypothetical protein
MSSSTRTFPRLERLVREWTVMALVAPAMVGVGLICFFAFRGGAQVAGVCLVGVGAWIGFLGLIGRQRTLRVLDRLRSSNELAAPASPPPALVRLVGIYVRTAVLGAVVAGTGVVCFFVLGARLQWVGIFLLVDGALMAAASLIARRRGQRLLDRIRSSIADP